MTMTTRNENQGHESVGNRLKNRTKKLETRVSKLFLSHHRESALCTHIYRFMKFSSEKILHALRLAVSLGSEARPLAGRKPKVSSWREYKGGEARQNVFHIPDRRSLMLFSLLGVIQRLGQ